MRPVRTVYAGRFCIPALPKHTLTFTDRGDVASVKIICIMIIGYLRVSTGKQHLANQQDEIRRFAESRKLVVDHWVTEVVSGKKSERDRKLGGLLRRLKKNDTLIVTEISRLSRTLTDIMAIMGKCLERGINLYTTKEGYSFDNTINSKVLCFAFGLVAEIERNLISMRTREALALRRAEGMVLGRRYGSYTKLNVLIENRQTVIAMLDRGKSIGDICRHFGLSRDTFAKFRVKYLSVQKALELNSTCKCNRILINNLFKFFVWREVSKSFTRSIIEFIFNPLNLFVGYFTKVLTLWDILPDKPVGVFIGTTFP